MERSQNTPETQSSQHLSHNGFPIIAILILAIAATAFLLISYYIFVTKRYFIWQQEDPLRRFSFRRTPPSVNPSASHSPLWQNQGLDESLIREIPTFQYSKSEFGHSSALWRCVVCLIEFQEHELLRVLPKCNHAFHLDCIDLWLQNCSNCPLCRSAISGCNRFRLDKISAPNSSPQDPQPMVGSEEDFAAIELSGEDGNGGLANRQQERINLSSFLAQSRSHSSRKLEQNVGNQNQDNFSMFRSWEMKIISFQFSPSEDLSLWISWCINTFTCQFNKKLLGKTGILVRLEATKKAAAEAKDRSFRFDMEEDQEMQFFPLSFSKQKESFLPELKFCFHPFV